MKSEQVAPAVAGPVERQVRPCAWYDPSDFTLTTSTQTAKERAPLYDQAALDAAVAAERERCAKICEGMRSEPTPYQGVLEYRVSEKAYEVAQECALDIRRA